MDTGVPRLWLASLSGRSDAAWATRASRVADAAVLGGIALDRPTREAAREMAERDREEFLPADPVAFLDRQLSALAGSGLGAGVNVRAVDPDAVRAAARTCGAHGAVLEVNAHCRQEEMCAAGAGQTLLRDPRRLREQVAAAADTGAEVGVKLRTEVPGVDLPAVAAAAVEAGAGILHVDAMDSEGEVARVVRAARSAAGGASEVTVVANNGVRDDATTREYLAYGADAVSVGRASDQPAVLRRVHAALSAWFEGRGPAGGRATRDRPPEVRR